MMLRTIFAVTLLSATGFLFAEDREPTREQLEFVETKVLPLLEARCFECHREQASGGLSMANRQAMLDGGDSGPSIVPGKPDESLIIEAVRYEGYEMPPRSRMPEAEVAILVRWIEQGAIWPAHLESAAATGKTAFPLEERKAEHWAWQPIQNPQIPAVANQQWPTQPLDRFILSRLEAAELQPAEDADRYAIIRRLYLDLTGLPPTVEQVQAFVTDESDVQAALAKVVDQLLASPHFGEHWGRHWLDLMRYAETLGHEFDYPLHHAWRYRDYVIRAFNQDVPYDQFVTEHIAGDLLTKPRLNPEEQFNESILGTSFWFLGEDKHAPVDVRGEEAAKIDNQIDVFSKAFLGMTVACARCHDHKFDAISTADYYAMSGVLQSSRRAKAWLDIGGKVETSLPSLRRCHINAVSTLKDCLADTTSFSSLKEYVTAATEAVQVLSTDPKQRSSQLDEFAKSASLNVKTLDGWINALSDKGTESTDSPFSVLHVLQAKNKSKALNTWKKKAAGSSQSTSKTTLFAEFYDGLPAGWSIRGPLNTPDLHEVRDAEIELSYHNRPTISTGGLSSSSLSDRLPATVFSSSFDLNHPEILVKIAARNAKIMVVIDGYHMQEFNPLLFRDTRKVVNTEGEVRWIRLSGDTHQYQGHRVHLEIQDDGDGWFELHEIRFADRRGANPPSSAALDFNRQLAKSVASPDQLVQTWIDAVQTACVQNRDDSVVRELVNRDLLPSLQDCDEWNDAVRTWAAQVKSIPVMPTAISIAEGTPENERIFIRGSHRKPGDIVQRGILTALKTSDWQPHIDSGRRQLARQLFADSNPLVARVAANRIWHHLMGRGIVDSTDNFGVLGNQPTHPELLDYLATSFKDGRWSWKSLIRKIVLSRSYRMSCVAHEHSRTVDPTNKLWHSAMVKRLTGETLRDATLQIAGSLNRTQFGPSVPIALTSFMQGRGRPRKSGPLDGNGRRSIYISVRRNFLSPLMLAFDVPAPVSTMGRRTVSNVPAQALLLLNNEFINLQAKKWATALMQDKDKSLENRIQEAWFQIYCRPPNNDEVQLMAEFVGPNATLESFTEMCHVLLNSKEFLFVR